MKLKMEDFYLPSFGEGPEAVQEYLAVMATKNLSHIPQDSFKQLAGQLFNIIPIFFTDQLSEYIKKAIKTIQKQ